MLHRLYSIRLPLLSVRVPELMDREEASAEGVELLYGGFRAETLADFPLVRDPGSGFDYSNLSSHILAIIVARAAGSDLGACRT